MAGHSKWANIKHKKERADAKRGKIFTRVIREITVAAKLGGPDPETNPRLRLAMDKASDANMPKDTVKRAIQRGAGELEGATYEEVRYEGYGAGGAAVMVDCLTDNRTRTVAEVRHAFSKHNGNLGTGQTDALLRIHKENARGRALRRTLHGQARGVADVHLINLFRFSAAYTHKQGNIKDFLIYLFPARLG